MTAKHNEANGENNTDGPDYNYSWNCGAEGPSRKKAGDGAAQKSDQECISAFTDSPGDTLSFWPGMNFTTARKEITMCIARTMR